MSLTFACYGYDRTEALRAGKVSVEGFDVEQLELFPREIFDRMATHQAFSACEFSFSEYVVHYAKGNSPFVAIPAFPSKVFRHGFMFVNRGAGIHTPKDLEGKRVGTQIYTQTASVWTRGMLAHDYGVDLSTIQWIQGNLDTPGRHTDAEIMPLLKPVRMEDNTSDKSLAALLEDGTLDALVTPRLPKSLGSHPDVVRLFPDFPAVELDYYKRTGLFPIMHLVVIRRDIYEAHPFVAKSLYDAFDAAKAKAIQRLRSRSVFRSFVALAEPPMPKVASSVCFSSM